MGVSPAGLPAVDPATGARRRRRADGSDNSRGLATLGQAEMSACRRPQRCGTSPRLVASYGRLVSGSEGPSASGTSFAPADPAAQSDRFGSARFGQARWQTALSAISSRTWPDVYVRRPALFREDHTVAEVRPVRRVGVEGSARGSAMRLRGAEAARSRSGGNRAGVESRLEEKPLRWQEVRRGFQRGPHHVTSGSAIYPRRSVRADCHCICRAWWHPTRFSEAGLPIMTHPPAVKILLSPR